MKRHLIITGPEEKMEQLANGDVAETFSCGRYLAPTILIKNIDDMPEQPEPAPAEHWVEAGIQLVYETIMAELRPGECIHSMPHIRSYPVRPPGTVATLEESA